MALESMRSHISKHLKLVIYLFQKENNTPAFDVDMNQPGIQDWLQEMKDKSLSHYDIMTVGEANGVNPDNAKSGLEKKKVNSI